ncbi:MAG TPA: NADPH:quinone reductase [Candidatus Baltobacteraceae bacterium]|jgi:NADPH2:quinone reductase|nr:NADPH:quinone reductase [Candidatus Baltobacteraceae bacterium]
MKAIRVHQFGGPEVMQLKNVADPDAGPGQVLIHTRAIGVNPVETYLRTGRNPNLPLPYTPGTDAAGEVASVGLGVQDLRPGARVYTSGALTGAYASMMVCDAADVRPLPDKISFAEGAALNIPYATAFRALFQRARATPGETVLIHGASGGVGTAAVQLARAAGLQVIGTAGSAKGEQLVRDLGAHHVLNHSAPDYMGALMNLTGGRGVNIILEMLANVNLGKDLTVLARNGRVIVIGSRGKVEIDARELMMRDADIRAMLLFNVTGADKASIHAALAAGLENGTLKPVIRCEMPLADASRAHQLVMEPGAHGKIILLP